MLTNPQLFLTLLLFAACGYWVIPASQLRWRQTLLIAISVVFIASLAPYALVLCAYMALVSWGWTKVWPRWHSTPLFWLAVVTVLLPLLGLRVQRSALDVMISLGITFNTLKCLTVVIQSYQSKEQVPLLDVLLVTFFFPIYSSGPIESFRTFNRESLAAEFRWAHVGEGVLRMSTGLFKAVFVCGGFLAPLVTARWALVHSDVQSLSSSWCLGFIFLNFLFVYINFSAYTDIAVGASRLFSLEVMENFNHPYLATNMTNFWQRWHISLGRWVINNIYFPIIRNTGWLILPIVITFFLVGVWHSSSPNYLVWGLGHGIGLAVVQSLARWGRWHPRYKKLSNTPAFTLVSWALTMFYVSWLSAVANSKGLAEAAALSARLFGL